MGKDIVKFGEKIVEKTDLYREDTKIFEVEDIDLDKIRISTKKIVVQQDH